MSSPTSKPAPARPYLSNGQVLQAPPFTVRIRNAASDVYNFFGLYFYTLFSLDAYAAAQVSPFNVQNRSLRRTGVTAPRGGPARGSGGGGGGGGGGGKWGGGGGGSTGGGKRIGTVDDVRGPECKSCG